MKFNSDGLNYKNSNFKLVKKILKKGDKIKKHNHEGCDILFTVVKGEVELLYNEETKYQLVPGDVFYFEGSNYIEADIIKDAEMFVTLINKK